MVPNWETIASLATAAGTLVLAVATFSSVRSANRTARAAERSLQIGLRPLLIQSRRDDPAQKIMFGDEQWVKIPGGAMVGEVRGQDGQEAIYLAMSLHNAGNGVAVIHGWRFYPDRLSGPDQTHPPPETFRMQGRDLYIPVNDTGSGRRRTVTGKTRSTRRRWRPSRTAGRWASTCCTATTRAASA